MMPWRREEQNRPTGRRWLDHPLMMSDHNQTIALEHVIERASDAKPTRERDIISATYVGS